MYASINKELSERLQSLSQRYRELGIANQIDFDKFYLYSIVAHSTAIEGSTVTEVEAQLLFDEGLTSSKRTWMEITMNSKLSLDDARTIVKAMSNDQINAFMFVLTEDPDVYEVSIKALSVA